MQDNKEAKKLYAALMKRGYTANEIGDETSFITKMQDKDNRKKFYNYAASYGTDLGDYDTYEKRLSTGLEITPQSTSTPTTAPTVEHGVKGRQSAKPAASTHVEGEDDPMQYVMDEDYYANNIQEDKKKEQTPPKDAVTAVTPKKDLPIEAKSRGEIKTAIKTAPYGYEVQVQKDGSLRYAPTEERARYANLDDDMYELRDYLIQQTAHLNEGKSEDEILTVQDVAKKFKIRQDVIDTMFGESATVRTELPAPSAARVQRDSSVPGMSGRQLAKVVGLEEEGNGEEEAEERLPQYRSRMTRAQRNAQQEVNDAYADIKAEETRKRFEEAKAQKRVAELKGEAENQYAQGYQKISWGFSSYPDDPVGLENYLYNHYVNPETKAAAATIDKAEEIEKLIKEAGYTNENWGTKQLGGAFRGLGQKLVDIGTWDFGATDVLAGRNAKEVFDKYEKRQNLLAKKALFGGLTEEEEKQLGALEITEQEQAYLEMIGLAAAAHEGYDRLIGHGYKVGEATGESLGYMMSFAASPTSGLGKAAAKGTAKAAGKAAMKKLDQTVVKGIVKEGKKASMQALERMAVKKYGRVPFRLMTAGGRVAGDVGNAIVITVTTGLGRTIGDYYDRVNGQALFDYDKEGNIVYGGQYGGVSEGTAAGKAITAQLVENVSEGLGEYLAPLNKAFGNLLYKGAKGVAKATGGATAKAIDGLADFIYAIPNTHFVKGMDGLLERAKFNGTLPEYLEEVASNTGNALLVGDMNFARKGEAGYDQSVFNRETNIVTFLSCAMMSGAINVTRAGGAAIEKGAVARQTSKAASAVEASCSTDEQKEAWRNIREQMEQATPSERVALVQECIEHTKPNDPKRKLFIDYAYALTYEQAYNASLVKARSAADIDQRHAMDAYDNGYHRTSMQTMNAAKNNYEYLRGKLKEMDVAEEAIDAIDSDPSSAIETIRAKWSGDMQRVALDYVYAVQCYNGMTQRIRDDIQGRIDQSNINIDASVNQSTTGENGENGKIQQATLKNGRKVYVVSGNITYNTTFEQGENGDVVMRNTINHNASDESIIIRDAETGLMRMVSPTELLSFDGEFFAEALKDVAAEQIRKEMGQTAVDNIDGKVTFQTGQTVQFVDDNGVSHDYTVVEDKGGDTITVTEDGKTNEEIPRDYFQQQADEERIARVAEADVQEETARAADEAQEQQAETEAREVKYKKGDSIIYKDAQGNEVAAMVVGHEENGNVVLYQGTDENGDDQTVSMSEADLNNALVSHNNASVASNLEEAQSMDEAQEAEAPTEIAPKTTATERIPQNEKGEPDYARAETPDLAWDALMEQTEGDAEMAQSVADAMVKRAKASLDKAQKAKLKEGASVQEMIDFKKNFKSNVEAAQTELDAWTAIADTQKRRAEEAKKAEEETKATETPAASGERVEPSKNAEEILAEKVKEDGYGVSSDVDMFGHPFIETKDGNITFGTIDQESGLTAAPIRLSMGENTIGEDGKNHGYGLAHIEAGHGQQIRDNGFASVEEFVEMVASSYTDIREGGIIAGNQIYLLELSDDKNNTLFIQLSRDGKYWNVNSAGIFKKKYSRNKPVVHTVPAVSSDTNTDAEGVNRGQNEGATATSRNSPRTSSASEVTDSQEKNNTSEGKVAENSEKEEVNTQETKAETKTDEGTTEQTSSRQRSENVFEKAARIDAENHTKSVRDAVRPFVSDKVKVVVYGTKEELPANVRKMVEDGKSISGWTNTIDGVPHVYLYAPAFRGSKGKTELQKTLLHEIVQHVGMEQLLGEKFEPLMRQLWSENMSDELRSQFAQYVWDSNWSVGNGLYHREEVLPGRSDVSWNDLTDEEKATVMAAEALQSEAADEWLAKAIETEDVHEKSWFKKFADAIREILRSMGVNIKLSDSEIADLWRQSYELLRSGSQDVTAEENTASENGERFRINTPAEKKGNLIAVHNLNAETLGKALDLGGFPMPSIAITKPEIGHGEFGDISLVFGSDTINPSDRRNKVYTADAWTPTFPTIVPKISEKARERVAGRVRSLLDGTDYANMYNLFLDESNMSDGIRRWGNFVDAYKNDTAMRIAFLNDKGIAFRPVMVDKKFGKYDSYVYERILKEIGNGDARYLASLNYDEKMALESKVRDILRDYDKPALESYLERMQEEGKEPRNAKVNFYSHSEPLNFGNIDRIIKDTYQYAQNAGRKELDKYATEKRVNNKFTKKLQGEFEQWLDKLGDGIIEKYGIRNNSDIYTSSGNRRSWEATHDKVTLDNVLKNMLSQDEKGGSGVFGGSPFNAAQERISSMGELRSYAEGHLAPKDAEKEREIRQAITDKFAAIRIPGIKEDFSGIMETKDVIVEALAQSSDAKGIYRYIHKWYPGMTMEIAETIAGLGQEIRNMQTDYLEAKPRRAVGFDEVKLAVVPNGTDAELVSRLENNGIPVKTYNPKKEGDRAKVLNKGVDEGGLRFRTSSLTEEQKAKVKAFEDEVASITEKAKADVNKLKSEIERTRKELESQLSFPEADAAESGIRFRVRESEPPTKTGTGYKVFVLKNGNLYPPMVANPNGEATPVGVWLDADAAPIAGESKTGRPQVKAGGKGTQGGSGRLAYRPGWHLGEIPYAKQFNRLNPETGDRELFPADFVWAEVEYAADKDYQKEAEKEGMTENGKFNHALAGLKKLPTDGYYMYRTNPDPTTDPWIITGSMKVNRILTPTEVDEMVEAAGREPQKRQDDAVSDEQVNELNTRYRIGSDKEIERLNDSFNKNLQKQIDGELLSGFVYELGMPSPYLASVGVDATLPIKLQSSILNTKSNDPAHPYDLEEIKDLVKMIQRPVAIFQYGNKNDARNLMIGIGQSGDEGKQFLVGLFMRPNVKGKGILEINSIRNVFPKNYHDWIHWVNQGKMLRVDDKEEIQAIINALRINPVDYIDKEDLDSASKVIENFVNPTLSTENNYKFRIKDFETELNDKVATEGLGKMYGEEYEDYLKEVFHSDEDIRRKIVERAAKMQWDFREATEKYLGELANDQTYVEARVDGTWDELKSMAENLLKPEHNLSDNELRYILWSNRQVATEGSKSRNIFNQAADITKQMDLKVGKYNADLGNVRFRAEDGKANPFEEAIFDAKLKLAANNEHNLRLRDDAMRAINKKIASIHQRAYNRPLTKTQENAVERATLAQRRYDRRTIDDLTRLTRQLMDAGFLNDMTNGEVKKIMSALNHANGMRELDEYADKILDVVINNQLKTASNALGKLLAIRGSKVDAKGVEVQGKLDIKGQRLVQTFKEAQNLGDQDLLDRIAKAENDMASPNKMVAENAAIEYDALNFAAQYKDNIRDSMTEEEDLKKEIKEAEDALVDGLMTKEAVEQIVKPIRDAIRQNHLERANATMALASSMGQRLKGSIADARAFREREKERVQEIYHNANSDMEGKPSFAQNKKGGTTAQQIANNGMLRFFLKPLANFDQMLRQFGSKSINGEGYLWNRFMRGWTDATDNEFRGFQEASDVLDKKVSEVFGKKMKWSDLYGVERKMPKAEVKIWDNGEQRTLELTQGNLLYIYMVNKMVDGQMKLRKMGIMEEDVDAITRALDPRFVELADWVQEEFLVNQREKYNEVYKRMFGASMANIENYFPLRILSNARVVNVDVSDNALGEARTSTTTGAVKKRIKNTTPLDLFNTDAFSVVIEHLQEMEHWAAFAEYNRDLNTLLSYNHFKNQVMNMATIYGSGQTLWKNFVDTAKLTAGTYEPTNGKNDNIDKLALNVAKGVTGAKISFRFYTALKQILSAPAFWSDINIAGIQKGITHPQEVFKWAMDNLPLFSKRWLSRQAGNEKLMETDMDWRVWHTKFVEAAARWGMTANAAVDAFTVALGAKMVYDSRYMNYIKDGYAHEQADRRAKQDAAIVYNESQQSNEGAFLSTMQVDRSFLSTSLSVFRNSPMGYQRQLVDSVRNLTKFTQKGYKEESIEFMTKQMMRDGLSEEQARTAAERKFKREIYRSAVKVGIFGFGLQLLWSLGPYAVYLLFGHDDDKKKEMLDDALKHSLFGAFEGLTGGQLISSVGNDIRTGKPAKYWNTTLMPILSDAENLFQVLDTDPVRATNDIAGLVAQMATGVNPQTLLDWGVAIVDWCSDADLSTGKEAGLFLLRFLSAPQSQIENLYFDEIDMSGDEAKKLSPKELIDRYAVYKMRRNAPLTYWMYSDGAKQEVKEKMEKKYGKMVSDRLKAQGDEYVNTQYDMLVGDYKEIGKKIRELQAADNEIAKEIKEVNVAIREAKKINDYAELSSLNARKAQLQAEQKEAIAPYEEFKQSADYKKWETIKDAETYINGQYETMMKTDDPQEARNARGLAYDRKQSIVRKYDPEMH